MYLRAESPSGRGPCTGTRRPERRRESWVGGARTRSPSRWRRCCWSLRWTGVARAQAPVASDFQKVTLDDNTQNPMELDVAPDGRVFYIERDGRLMIWKPNTQQTVTAGTVPVTTTPGERAARAAAGARTSRSATGSTCSTRSCPTARTRRSSRASRSTATRWTSARSSASSRSAPARAVLPLVGLAVLRPGRQPVHLDGRQHEPVRLERLQPDRRALRPLRVGRAAHAARTRTTSTARSCGSSRWRSRSARPGPGDDVHDPRRQPLPRRHGADAARRSSAWASATRSGSRSTPRPAGC